MFIKEFKFNVFVNKLSNINKIGLNNVVLLFISNTCINI